MFTARYGLELCIIRVCIKLGHIVAQAVSCQPLTAEAPYDICRARSDSRRDISSRASFFPPMVHAYQLYAALTKGQKDEYWGRFYKQCSFENWEALVGKYLLSPVL